MLRVVVVSAAPPGSEAQARILARTLRDSGHEVILVGSDPPAGTIVSTAVQEDADLVVLCRPDAGASALPPLRAGLAERDATDIPIELFTEQDAAAVESWWALVDGKWGLST